MTREGWNRIKTRFPTAWALLEEYNGIQPADDEAWRRLVAQANELEEEYRQALISVLNAIERIAKKREAK